ncbi:MAG TPA: DUF2924 domain-containing protein [Candidatus Eisenbacteria bacterium]|nr:DUF2924 domain-containing protein [Candidatus Eisenbacteria bacterium]
MRRNATPAEDTKRLADELAALSGLSYEVLKARWQDLFGAPLQARLSRRLLMYAIAYRMQEQVLGGLTPATRRKLARAAQDLAKGRAPTTPATTIKPGTRLLREWQGLVHEVIVLERGVQYRGRTWPSLSKVAREITGTRWSGPLFFGLKRRRDGRR